MRSENFLFPDRNDGLEDKWTEKMQYDGNTEIRNIPVE